VFYGDITWNAAFMYNVFPASLSPLGHGTGWGGGSVGGEVGRGGVVGAAASASHLIS